MCETNLTTFALKLCLIQWNAIAIGNSFPALVSFGLAFGVGLGSASLLVIAALGLFLGFQPRFEGEASQGGCARIHSVASARRVVGSKITHLVGVSSGGVELASCRDRRAMSDSAHIAFVRNLVAESMAADGKASMVVAMPSFVRFARLLAVRMKDEASGPSRRS